MPHSPSKLTPRSTLLSLRMVISTLGVILVAVVAAVTLTLTLTSSLAALRSVGRTQALLLLQSVEVKTEGLFEKEFRAIEAMDRVVRSLPHPWPSNDPRVIDEVFMPQLQMIFFSLGPRQPVLMNFWDNTRLSITLRNSTHYDRIVELPSPVSAPGGLANQSLADRKLVLGPLNGDDGSPARQPYPLPPGFEWRTLNTSSKSTFLTLTAGGTRTAIAGYIVRAAGDPDNATRFFVEKFVPVMAPLHRQGDPRDQAHLYATFTISLFIEDISVFLRAARSTPNTAAFATDRFGYLMGSSEDAPFITETVVPPGTPPGLGCASTGAIGSLSRGNDVFMVCRASHAAYGHAGLAALGRDTFQHDGSRVALADGSFVASQGVALRYAGFDIRLVLIIPEADIIGDVVTSRNVAIGVVAALVVASIVVNFATVHVLLRPLSGIARRMQRAANLEDDGEDEGVSAMAEVAELQEAYYAMNEELNRIRAFVPQSVLMARKTDHDHHEADEDLDLADGPNGESVNHSSGGDDGCDVRSQCVRSGQQSCAATVVSRRSTNTTHTSGVNGAATRNLATYSLKPTNVTVLVANTCGFAAAVAAAGRADAIERTTQLVELVHGAVTAAGGVLANYHGDHFTATFNAAKPCASHAAAGCRAALAIRDGAGGAGFGAAVRCGVATGRCLVGTLGCRDVKAFSTVGPAFQQACVLERMARLYTATGASGQQQEAESVALANRRACLDAATVARTRIVDIVRLPGAKAPALIARVESLIAHADEAGGVGNDGNDNEWLYLVGTAEAGDPYRAWNEAFETLSLGRVDSAVEMMEPLRASQPSIEATRRFNELLVAGTDSRFRDLGSFYETGFGCAAP